MGRRREAVGDSASVEKRHRKTGKLPDDQRGPARAFRAAIRQRLVRSVCLLKNSISAGQMPPRCCPTLRRMPMVQRGPVPELMLKQARAGDGEALGRLLELYRNYLRLV